MYLLLFIWPQSKWGLYNKLIRPVPLLYIFCDVFKAAEKHYWMSEADFHTAALKWSHWWRALPIFISRDFIAPWGCLIRVNSVWNWITGQPLSLGPHIYIVYTHTQTLAIPPCPIHTHTCTWRAIKRFHSLPSLTLDRVIEGGAGSDQYVCAINSQ